jgi:hypothetical protein
MPPIEHTRPAESLDDHTRVRFELEDSELGDAEVLWGRWITPGTVRLDNIPLLISGVSMGDVVHVTVTGGALLFASVAERGGHSTYRVMLEKAEDASVEKRLREIIVLGCGYERITPRFLALDVPRDVDVFRVYDLLERGLAARIWTFEEGHCGHPVDE